MTATLQVIACGTMQTGDSGGKGRKSIVPISPGGKIDGVLFFPESFEYRTHLSSDFVSNYVHFGF